MTYFWEHCGATRSFMVRAAPSASDPGQKGAHDAALRTAPPPGA
eukprot:IDg4799t1